MNAKRVIAGMIAVGVLVGILGIWYVWARVTKLEERGVAVGLKVEPTSEERATMEKQLNQILDQDELLDKLVADCDLVAFYGASSAEDAKAMARERSRVYFFNPNRLFIVHQAKRFERGDNDRIGKRLGELFRDEAFGEAPSPPESGF